MPDYDRDPAHWWFELMSSHAIDKCIRQTPMQTFIDSIPLAKEKMIAVRGEESTTTDNEDLTDDCQITY